MAKGFKDSSGKFHPTGNKGTSSRSKSTKAEGIVFNPTKKRVRSETKSLAYQLGNFLPDKKVFVKEFNIPPETFLKAVEGDPNWIPAFGKNSIKELKERMEKGETIDKPFLIILRFEDTEFLADGKEKKVSHDEIAGHQGRHRAYTAKGLGVKSIPVEVYCKQDGITTKCTEVDRKVLENAMSQFTPIKDIEKREKESDKNLEKFKKNINKLKKKKNPRSDEEVILFTGEFDIKRGEHEKKIREQMDARAEKNRKEIKELFNG